MTNRPEKPCDEIEAARQQAKTLDSMLSHTATAVGFVQDAMAKAVECSRCGDPSDGKRLCKVCRVQEAGPKLLTACKQMYAIATGDTPFGGMGKAIIAGMALIREAIAEAEGGE